VVGPDVESEPLVAAVAAGLGVEHAVCAKQRLGDKEVRLTLNCGTAAAGRAVAVVDDIAASGATLQAVLDLLRANGAASMEVYVVHALLSAEAGDALRAAGANRVVSSDSCRNWSNELHLSGLLADALAEELSA
jgi:ribose-phosphate pyrophosphokinase